MPKIQSDSASTAEPTLDELLSSCDLYSRVLQDLDTFMDRTEFFGQLTQSWSPNDQNNFRLLVEDKNPAQLMLLAERCPEGHQQKKVLVFLASVTLLAKLVLKLGQVS
jgi:hypothetical protein